MFLSSLLGSSSGRKGSYQSNKSSKSSKRAQETSPSPSTSPSRSHDAPCYDYLSDESHLRPAEQPSEHLLDLNKSLETLATLFPDIQIEVFREMLSTFSEESQLFVVTDMLLKNAGTFVKGRRRTADESADEKTEISRAEAFRSPEYKAAVRFLALQEFKGLSKSAIDAVLSESNYWYLGARPTLVELSSRSWKFAISSLLFRRKPVTSAEAEVHPLIVWRASDDGPAIPSLKSTGSAELDKELFQELIMPLIQREKASKEQSDREFALSLYTEEAEACGATYECACCFTDSVFEEFTTCSTEGHMVCFRCVRHSITEAVFGQGWQRSINKDTGTLRCLAVSSDECTGCISSDDIQQAMREEKQGAEVLHKFDQRLADHDLISSGLSLVRCPFCNYAEVDELYMPAGMTRPKLRMSNLPNAILIIICLLFFPFSLPILLAGLICLLPCLSRAFRDYVSQQAKAAFSRYQRRRRGLKFICQNPICARPSCLSCSKAWIDIHVCHESSLVALRTQVEQAMSMAVKRVCPRCNTSFIKNSGCNKLSCPCGYKMCYCCRKDIGKDGYQHFCPHFRVEGDGSPCKECNKCNLWEQENTDVTLRRAKEEVERKWRDTERRELSDAEKAYLEDDAGHLNVKEGVLGRVFPTAGPPSVEEIFDLIIETLFV
ncbi:Uu.00g016640.m01.CDS01 [Anthostomella pinea]|uniref:Uu.00g016640.m01.CDS01 n=1 Tax=Anthostomella pinea TaxID=933095 RepID=A0AAI8VZM8_9PEZI|nr:Uu.00g016640.m01.CDS01 [Anthostomella pinea]